MAKAGRPTLLQTLRDMRLIQHLANSDSLSYETYVSTAAMAIASCHNPPLTHLLEAFRELLPTTIHFTPTITVKKTLLQRHQTNCFHLLRFELRPCSKMTIYDAALLKNDHL